MSPTATTTQWGHSEMVNEIWPLASAAEMRALDRYTIESIGIPGEILMEVAGRAVAERAIAVLERPDDPIEIVCGLGNNGGDGFVAARHLALNGAHVTIVLLGDPEMLRDAAAFHYQRALACKVPVIRSHWQSAGRGIVIDALFGTGLSRRLEGDALERVEEMNRAALAGAKLICVDIPSGVDADSGRVWGAAVRATETLTIGLPKLGLTLEPGRALAGAVYLARVGIADEAPGIEIAAQMWSRKACALRLPGRPVDAHKGRFGHVLVAAGSRGKSGAAHLAGLSALRSGAGLVTLACPASLEPVLEIKSTEAMTVGLADTEGQSFAVDCVDRLLALARDRDAVAIGPGVGTDRETGTVMREFAKRFEGPLVIDADGLNAFAADGASLEMLQSRPGPTILTPHPGEAARLLAETPQQLNRDRVASARTLARRSGAIVVLKGAASVIANASGRILVNPTGGPALATAGTGDVLTGMIAAYLAQGCSDWEATALAVWIHGDAADRLASRQGPSGLLAADLADEIPLTCRALAAAAGEDEGFCERPKTGFLLPFPAA